MMEVKGKYNTAKVFTDHVEESAIEQIRTLCDMAYAEGSRIRIMPDVHAGAGCTIGTTMTIQDKVVPNLVGVDIGCGMETILLGNRRVEPEKLDKLIRERIPSGMNIRDTLHQYNEDIDLNSLRCKNRVNLDRARKSIGSLGGGNHFIELNKDEEGHIYLVVHSGSRHIGTEVARLYQDLGIARLGKASAEIPQALAYVGDDLFDDYIHDMKIIQHFALLNRKAMVDEIVRGMKLDVLDRFTTTHNYIDTQAMILRKGAVSAKAGEQLLIPINMRDGSLICIGKGNEDWNFSAPHGAGRLMSRTAARNTFTLSEFRKQMTGIFTTSCNKDTLDECPMAYKTMDEIVGNISPTADILRVIRPVYNFKAGE